jgi:hypothetical protein
MLVTPEQQQAAAAAQRLYNAAPNPTLAAQEAQRLAQLGLGSGAAAFGAAPGLRTPVSSIGGPTGNAGASGGNFPTRSPSLDMSPQDITSWADFENQYWDPFSLEAAPTPEWTDLESQYWNDLGPQTGPTPGSVEDITQFMDQNLFSDPSLQSWADSENSYWDSGGP